MPVSKPIPKELNALIEVQPLLAPLPQDAREKLIADSSVMSFNAGELLIEEDEPNYFLYLLLKGQASAIMNGTQAGELEAGDIAGEISAIGLSPPIASVIADSDLEAIAFPVESIIGAAREHAEFGERLRRAAIKRVS
ncbi:MAG: cyclic nucleotide-binding domain-containing protein, partial [Mariprofundaceae bacterium]|nr:cyclic nucleotide-binding domain-containing protein [Mariprofundaceae bacterium]